MRRRSAHSAWMDNQAALLVKGSLDVPLRMSSTDKCLTTESSVCLMKLHTWQEMSLQSGALRLAKSDGNMAAPATCWTVAWYRLTVDRKEILFYFVWFLHA